MEQNNDKYVIDVDYSSDIKPVKYSYKWTINNYSSLADKLKNGYFYESPVFNAGSQEWGIDIYPKGYNSDCDEYVSVYISSYNFMFHKADKDRHSAVRTFFTVSILNSKGTEVATCKKAFSDTCFRNKTAGFDRFVHQAILMKKKDELLPNNVLTLLCEFSFCGFPIPKKEFNEMIVKERRLVEFDDFEKLLKKPKFSDFEIIVGNQILQVHKAILSARSRIFEVLFENIMKEQRKNCIVIKEVDFEVMELLIRYIYIGKLEAGEVQRFRYQLYIIADKYEINGLKQVSKDMIIESLNIDNVAYTLNFTKYLPISEEVESIEKAAINFVIENSNQLIDSHNFQETCKSLPASLLLKIINALMLTK